MSIFIKKHWEGFSRIKKRHHLQTPFTKICQKIFNPWTWHMSRTLAQESGVRRDMRPDTINGLFIFLNGLRWDAQRRVQCGWPSFLSSPDGTSTGSVFCFFLPPQIKTFYFALRYSQLTMLWKPQGGQKRDSAIHTHVSILPQTPLPARLPHDTEQSSLCWTAGPCWLSMLNTALCACPSQTPNLFSRAETHIYWTQTHSSLTTERRKETEWCLLHCRGDMGWWAESGQDRNGQSEDGFSWPQSPFFSPCLPPLPPALCGCIRLGKYGQPIAAKGSRMNCPSPTPRVHPNPCPSSRWCHPLSSSSPALSLSHFNTEKPLTRRQIWSDPLPMLATPWQRCQPLRSHAELQVIDEICWASFPFKSCYHFWKRYVVFLLTSSGCDKNQSYLRVSWFQTCPGGASG